MRSRGKKHPIVEVLHLGVGDLRTVKSEYATTKKPAPKVKNVKSLSMFVSDFYFLQKHLTHNTGMQIHTYMCMCETPLLSVHNLSQAAISPASY